PSARRGVGTPCCARRRAATRCPRPGRWPPLRSARASVQRVTALRSTPRSTQRARAIRRTMGDRRGGDMSQRWGIAFAVLLLIVAAAIVVAVLARGPRGAHARRPRRPRALMVSGLVVLAGAAFAGAWAATVTSNPLPSGGPGSGPTRGGGQTSGGGPPPRVPSGQPVPEGSPAAVPPPDVQVTQISGGRVGAPVRQVIAAATERESTGAVGAVGPLGGVDVVAGGGERTSEQTDEHGQDDHARANEHSHGDRPTWSGDEPRRHEAAP